jgi:hypothetical protein
MNPMNYIEEVTAMEMAMKYELAKRAEEEARLLKRYDLDNIDLEAEYVKIQKHESYLSAKKRAVVCEIVEARRFNGEIGKIIDFDIAMHTPQRGVKQSPATRGDGGVEKCAADATRTEKGAEE